MSRQSRENMDRADDTDPPSKRARREDDNPIPGRHREIGLMRQDGEQDTVSFVGSASGIYFARSVYHAMTKVASPEGGEEVNTPPANLVPGEDDHLNQPDTAASTKPLWRDSELNNTNQVSMKDLHELSQEYFENWHPAFAFLHAPTVLGWFEKATQRPLHEIGSLLGQQELTILRSIMSISIADRRQIVVNQRRTTVPAPLVFHSYIEAIESIQSCLTTPATLKSLQAAISVQLFLVSMLRHNGASRLGALIVRLAFSMGLHRCPVRYPTFTPEDVQMRKRVFHTLCYLDRHICQSLGLPLGIHDDDVDVCSFAHERHQSDSAVNIPFEPRLAHMDLLIRHAEIKGMIIEICNKSTSHRQVNADKGNAVEAALAKWKNDVDALLDMQSDDQFLNTAHKTTLQVLRHEGIIALNRSLLALPKTTTDYSAALHTCIAAARSAINDLHNGYRTLVNEAWAATGDHTQVPLFWPSFTWVIWMSSFIILYATAEGEMPKPVAMKLLEKSIEVLNHLSARGTVWPNACAAAVRDLCSRLKYVPTYHDRVPPSGSITSDVPATHPEKGHIGPARETSSTITNPTTQVSDFDVNQLFAQSNDFQIPSSDSNASYWPAGASLDSIDATLFDRFDIPFWMGDDQYGGMPYDWQNMQG